MLELAQTKGFKSFKHFSDKHVIAMGMERKAGNDAKRPTFKPGYVRFLPIPSIPA